MANNIAHFAFHADNLVRGRRFYERVFGWQFRPWGPPEFFLIRTGTDEEPGIQGALQRRQEPGEGTRVIAFECTISVTDLGEITRAIEAEDGKVIMPEMVIPGVGRLIRFQDTEDNVAWAMHYDKSAE